MTEKRGDTLKISDEEIIAALLSAETNRKAADICGLSERQLYKRMRSDDFKIRYARARGQILDRATTTVQSGMNEAVCTMIDIMRNTDISPQTRLNAADSVLRNGLKLTEQNEILQRLERLEEMNHEQ